MVTQREGLQVGPFGVDDPDHGHRPDRKVSRYRDDPVDLGCLTGAAAHPRGIDQDLDGAPHPVQAPLGGDRLGQPAASA